MKKLFLAAAALLAGTVGVSMLTVGTATAVAQTFADPSGSTVVTGVVLPSPTAGSSTPQTITATVSYSGTTCTPCSVHFYVTGIGWATNPPNHSISNGQTGTFSAMITLPAAGKYPVQLALYGPSGNNQTQVDIGTISVGGTSPTIDQPVANPPDVLPGTSTTLSANAHTPSTSFSVEFQARGQTQWVTKGTGVTNSSGMATSTVAPDQSGAWRFRTGSVVSPQVVVEVASKIRVNGTTASRTSVRPGEPVDLSATAYAEYPSKTVAVPAGTPFSVVFYSGTNTGGTAVATGTVDSAGRATATVHPTETGLWSIRLLGAESMTPERVTVSAATGTGDPVIVSPSDGSTFFTGQTATLTIDFSNAPASDYAIDVNCNGVSNPGSNYSHLSTTYTYDGDPQVMSWKLDPFQQAARCKAHVYNKWASSDGTGDEQDLNQFSVQMAPAPTLVKHTATKVLSPQGSFTGTTLIGDCSQVSHPARPDRAWRGSLRYLSNYDGCASPTASDMAAVTEHTLTLPAAYRYGSIRVSAYGARAVAGYPSRGALVYEDGRGNISGVSSALASAEGWHRAKRVPLPGFVQGRSFRWWAGTSNANFYDIRSFKVTYTYFTLR